MSDTSRFGVYIMRPRFKLVGWIELPAALVAAYPQLMVALRAKVGVGGAQLAHESVLLHRAIVTQPGGHQEPGLVVEPGRDLDVLRRLDEFTPALDAASFRALEAMLD